MATEQKPELDIQILIHELPRARKHSSGNVAMTEFWSGCDPTDSANLNHFGFNSDLRIENSQTPSKLPVEEQQYIVVGRSPAIRASKLRLEPAEQLSSQLGPEFRFRNDFYLAVHHPSLR